MTVPDPFAIDTAEARPAHVQPPSTPAPPADGVTPEMTTALARTRVGVLLVAVPLGILGLLGAIIVIIQLAAWFQRGDHGVMATMATLLTSALPAALAYSAWKLVGFARSLGRVSEYRDLVSTEDALIHQRKFWKSFGVVHLFTAMPVVVGLAATLLLGPGFTKKEVELERWARKNVSTREYVIDLETADGRRLSVECYAQENYCVCLEHGEQTNDIDHFGGIPDKRVDAIAIGRACGWKIACPPSQATACFAAGQQAKQR